MVSTHSFNKIVNQSLKKAGKEKRILIIGANGAGKTVLAEKLSAHYSIKLIELDRIFWKPEWEKSTREEFYENVKKELSLYKEWIADGNYYSNVSELVWTAANVIIWLDYNMGLVAGRVIARTLKNIVFKRKLFDNNYDSFRRMITPKDSIVVWSLKTFRKKRRNYTELYNNHTNDKVKFYRFRKPGETEEFLKGIGVGCP